MARGTQFSQDSSISNSFRDVFTMASEMAGKRFFWQEVLDDCVYPGSNILTKSLYLTVSEINVLFLQFKQNFRMAAKGGGGGGGGVNHF